MLHVRVVEVDAKGNKKLEDPRVAYSDIIKEVPAPKDPKGIMGAIERTIFDAGDTMGSRKRRDIIRHNYIVACVYKDSDGKLCYKRRSPNKLADADAITYLVANAWHIKNKYDDARVKIFTGCGSSNHDILSRVARSLFDTWVYKEELENYIFDEYVHDLNQYETGKLFTYIICNDWNIIRGGTSEDYYYRPDDALRAGERRLGGWF